MLHYIYEEIFGSCTHVVYGVHACMDSSILDLKQTLFLHSHGKHSVIKYMYVPILLIGM